MSGDTDEDWIRCRDDRGRRIADWKGSSSTTIEVGDALSRCPAVQAFLVVLIGIASRTVLDITVVAADAPYYLDSRRRLSTILRHEALKANPGGTFRFDATPPVGQRMALVDDSSECSTSVTFDDHGVSIGDKHRNVTPATPVLAGILAGCLAGWRLLRDKTPSLPSKQSIDIRLPRRIPADRVDAKMCLIGGGGVGSNLAWFLHLMQSQGCLDIIDYKVVDVTSLGRCLPFEKRHADDATLKTDALADVIGGGTLHLRAHAMVFADFVRSHGRPGHDIIFMMANEHGVWNDVQRNMPGFVVSAGTSEAGGADATRHIPMTDPCVACRWGVRDDHEPTYACSEARLAPDVQEPIYGVLPFQAPLSAALALYTWLALGQGRTNVLTLDGLLANPRLVPAATSRRPDCYCASVDPSLYAAILGTTPPEMMTKKGEDGDVPTVA